MARTMSSGGPAAMRRLSVALLAAALVGSACGDDGGGDDAQTTPTAAATASTSTTTSSTTTIAPSPEAIYDFSGIGAIVDGFVEEKGLNGAGMVVVHADDGVVFEHTAGEFTPGRISLVASASKQVSAVVLARLHDDGLLDLDAPIAESVDWADDHPTVTAAQLLTSSSGLPGLGAAHPDYECQYTHTGSLQGCAEQILRSDQDDLEVVAPDTEFRYGGAQWHIAGAVAEAVSGRSWAQLVEEFLVEPCGLDVLAYGNHFEQLGGLSATYPAGFDGDPSVLEPTDNPNTEAGMYTDTADYAQLLLLHLRDGRCGDTQVLSPGTVERLHRDRVGEVYGDARTPTEGYAMGWWVERETGILRGSGAYGSVPWLDLEDGYGVFVALESEWWAASEVKDLLEGPIDDVVAAATSSSPSVAGTTTPTVSAPVRPYATEVLTTTYVDESRVTRATEHAEEESTRTLDVWIDRPLVEGPRPLVIFAHGLTGHPRDHEMLRSHLATEGFVVVSPAFPLTNGDVPDWVLSSEETAEQVTDISFLIDSVRADPDIGPLLDDGPVGLIGHSLGGATVAGASLGVDSRDERIGAAVVMSSAPTFSQMSESGDASAPIPVMFLMGDQDAGYEFAVAAYAGLTGPRMLVSLLGGDHTRGILDDDTDQGEAVRAVAAAFVAHTLGVEDGQVSALDTAPLDDVVIQAGGPAEGHDDWRTYFG